MLRLIQSFSAIAVFDQLSRWKSRWTSAQSCTLYTFPPQVGSTRGLIDHCA